LRPRGSALESSSGFSQHRKLVLLKLEFFKGVRLERQRREFGLSGEPHIFCFEFAVVNETLRGV